MVSKVEAAVDPDSILRDRDILLRVHRPVTVSRQVLFSACTHHCVRSEDTLLQRPSLVLAVKGSADEEET